MRPGDRDRRQATSQEQIGRRRGPEIRSRKARRKVRGDKCNDTDDRATQCEPAMRPDVGCRRQSSIDENAYARPGKDQRGPREEDEVAQTWNRDDVRERAAAAATEVAASG